MKTIEITETNIATVLELFNKDIDDEGYIIEKRTGERLVCPFSSSNIHANDFSILPGSAIFVTNQYYCFAEYLSQNRQV